MKKTVVFLFVISLICHGYGQQGRITAENLKAYVSFLASDSLKGRKPGTPEMMVAATYIRDHFRQAGLKLLGDNGFQWFEIVTDIKLGTKNKLVFNGQEAKVEEDWIPLAFSGNGASATEVVFAGFGIEAATDSLKWNDFANVDINGKWVMILRGDPEPDIADSKFIPFGDIRSKVLTIKDKGAAGVLLVTPKSMDKEDKLMKLVSENNEMTAGIPVINLKRELANKLLAGKNIRIDSLERSLVATKMPASFNTGVVMSATTEVILEHQKTANVIGMIEGSDPLLKDEILVIGAHYDHLGMGGSASGSRMPDTVAVHNGADDNASGTAMVMALASAFSAERQNCRRSLLFVAFSGEEMGLLGSKYFVNTPVVDIKKIKSMFNFDMVGRFDPDKNSISVGGTGTSLESDSLLRMCEQGLPFQVVHSPDGYGPSDHAAFYSSNIPVFFFNTGVHTDYHTPFDDVEKLDFNSEKLIGDFAYCLIGKVNGLPAALAFRESGSKSSSGGRTGRRLQVRLGILPDSAGSEKSGLRVDGVSKDGPAEKGGIKKGDIIVGINGMKVANIYEYMSRLQKLKHGMTINVEIIRNGKNEVLLIQL